MRIGVLGGYGFVGSHVVDRLVGAGHEVHVYDECSSCWLAADGESARFANPDALELLTETGVVEVGCEVVVDARLRHPLGREIVLYREALDRARSGVDLAISGARRRTLRRFVVVSSLEVLSGRGPLGAHLRAYREALAYLHRPPVLDVEFVHLPELYGPRQLPEAGDVAAAICGGDVGASPTFGHLGYVEDAAAVLAERATRAEHRASTEFFVSAPVADSELLYKVLKTLGDEEAARRAVSVSLPKLRIAVEADAEIDSTPIGAGVAETLEFYRWVAAEEEAGR